jgi:calcium/calmodulin-dependent 3',5'-cyclic nucleotide phosphodiesterase
MDLLEGGADDLPKIGSADAPSAGAERLRMLLSQLERGETPATVDLKVYLSYAASVLEHVSKTDPYTRSNEEEDDLPDVTGEMVPDQVRDWLASTFTRRSSASVRRENGQAITLRGVVQAVRMHIKLNTAHKLALGPQYPQAVRDSQNVDGWSFDVFYLNTLTDQPLRYVGFEVFRRYDLMSKFKIPVNVLDSFLQQIESGYNLHGNPYHNSVHASDVTQSMHSLLWETGLKDWLSDLEVLGALLAAITHDVEHTGTTNTFHIQSRSDTAFLYNDKSVLENHHLSTAFRLMKKEECNVLSNLTSDEFREIRALVIEMVLATDMSSHFHQLNSVKSMISGVSGPDNLDKTKSLSLCLHCCDIGHPTKDWKLHEVMTDRLVEEFFRQGDREQELGLPYSPLCDRSTTLVPESQVGFIDFIVKPSFEILKDMLDVVLPLPTNPLEEADSSKDAKEDNIVENMQQKHNLWMEGLTNNCLSNRDCWKDRFRPKGDNKHIDMSITKVDPVLMFQIQVLSLMILVNILLLI